MNVTEFEKLSITKPDEKLEKAIKLRWDQVAKPLDSLGKFENITSRIGAILGSEKIDIRKKAVLVMCADNGIVEEGISQSGMEVTALLAEYMGRQQTSVCKMAQSIQADIIPVDIGICTKNVIPGVLQKKIVMGTKNFMKEPAITEEEVMNAIEVGIELVKDCKEKGYTLLGTGELGIGNTTTSAAVAAALLGGKADVMAGRGAGASDAALLHKKEIIEAALEKYRLQPQETFRILQCVGGLDIAGMVGIFVGGALCHIPIVADGVISVTAALAAERLKPGVKDYVIPSHRSREPAAGLILEQLQLDPVIEGSLALGEGTGAVMMFSLLDMVTALYKAPLTFADIQLEQYARSKS